MELNIETLTWIVTVLVVVVGYLRMRNSGIKDISDAWDTLRRNEQEYTKKQTNEHNKEITSLTKELEDCQNQLNKQN